MKRKFPNCKLNQLKGVLQEQPEKSNDLSRVSDLSLICRAKARGNAHRYIDRSVDESGGLADVVGQKWRQPHHVILVPQHVPVSQLGATTHTVGLSQSNDVVLINE